jgi:hypothetical protein
MVLVDFIQNYFTKKTYDVGKKIQLKGGAERSINSINTRVVYPGFAPE